MSAVGESCVKVNAFFRFNKESFHLNITADRAGALTETGLLGCRFACLNPFAVGVTDGRSCFGLGCAAVFTCASAYACVYAVRSLNYGVVAERVSESGYRLFLIFVTALVGAVSSAETVFSTCSFFDYGRSAVEFVLMVVAFFGRRTFSLR